LPETVDLSKYDNSWYHPGRNLFVRVCWVFISAFFVQCHWNPSTTLRVFLLRLFGAKIGKGVVIKPGVNIKYPWHLSIGDYVWIGENAWIDNLTQISIGNHACLSQGAYLLTGNHDFKKNTFDLIVKPITIEAGVWIGAKAIVCPSVTCYSHAVLTAGAVATKDLQSYTIYSGNPAQPVKQREILLS
jgi:putative colanic acid biosynthesis acetyltransferase WcaF